MTQPTVDKEFIESLYQRPFFDLIDLARTKYKEHFKPNTMELCTLLSFKTGGCPENCAYCPQSAHYNTGLIKEPLLDCEKVVEQAKIAQANGSKRFCMGGAWRVPPKRDFPKLIEMIKAVKAIGLETCLTVGMLTREQAEELKEAGLDFYNHNIDTSPEYYKKIVTTRTYQDRLDTVKVVAESGMSVCCGGIIGMGESRDDRVEFLWQLTKLQRAPESIPINKLIRIPGTPLANVDDIDNFEFVRTIAVTRILFPQSMVRLSAGRSSMSEEMQAWAFMAGANSIFLGDKLLTAPNPEMDDDLRLLDKLGISRHAERIS
jgi:biotin synthase